MFINLHFSSFPQLYHKSKLVKKSAKANYTNVYLSAAMKEFDLLTYSFRFSQNTRERNLKNRILMMKNITHPPPLPSKPAVLIVVYFQYIEEHLKNKRQRESINPCTWTGNPCQWCDQRILRFQNSTLVPKLIIFIKNKILIFYRMY